MTRNMGTADRAVRAFLVAPLAVIAAIAVGIGTVGGIILLAVAAVMLATSAVGFCPLYALLRIHTGGRHRPARV
jgi:Protein of unknown function (DUF2892)